MVRAPTAEGFYSSAASFARSALDAHHKGDQQRLALFAATALEHLIKACLVERSPALIVEMKSGETSWHSLMLLCGVDKGRPSQLRTVGLREALVRAKAFLPSTALIPELSLLVDLRDGVVHAALDDVVEERLLVAFLRYADAALVVMARSRAEFWGERVDIVDTLLTEATDKVAQRVQTNLVTARVAFNEKSHEWSDEVRELLTKMEPWFDESSQAIIQCPACGCHGVASGELSIDETPVEFDRDGEPMVYGWVKITPSSFFCHVCRLRLETPAELMAAGLPEEWELTDLLVSDFVARDWEDYG